MEIKLKTGTLSLEENKLLDELIGFSSRINKKRGFLFVSKVLGKHIPTKPSLMKLTHMKLANKLKENLNEKNTVFIGFAETATGIGNGVFEEANLSNAFYIHTSRYNLSKERLLEFKEEHCHAPSHILYKPTDQNINDILEKAENIVLVDDEITTGNTLNNIVSVLKENFPQVKNYYSVSIISWIKKFNPEINYISLYSGDFTFLSNDFVESQNIISEAQEDKYLDSIIPNNFGRFGIKHLNTDYSKIIDYKSLINKKVLVLGTGEFMYQSYKLSRYLEKNNIDVYVQSTTRSPVNVDLDIKSKIQFIDNYGEKIDNFLYNVIDKNYDLIIICYETEFIPKEHNLKQILSEKFSVQEIFFKN
jgi:hypoxanthine-guanine phosphoribosyltransferase